MHFKKRHKQFTSAGSYHFRYHCVLRVLNTYAEELFKENTTVPPAAILYEDSMHFTCTLYLYNVYDSNNKQPLFPYTIFTDWSV
jgi:hypothetical protein